jgi:hypothetical protein
MLSSEKPVRQTRMSANAGTSMRPARWPVFAAVLMSIAMLLGVAGPAAAASSLTSPVSGPSISSDKADYAPGEHVVLRGTGWQPGEKVAVYVEDDENKTWFHNVDVTADDMGGIIDEFDLPTWFVATYTVSATGAASGLATTTFTDGNFAFQLATAATSTPPNWSVSWQVYTNNACTTPKTTGSNNSGTANYTGNTLTSGAQAGASNNEFVKATAVTASGYSFNFWTATQTGTNQIPAPCAAGFGGSGVSIYAYAHFSAASAATTLAAAPATATYGGTTSLSATLKSGATGVSGKSVAFKLNGDPAGSATTNTSGVATLSNVSVSGINAGTYATGVEASFTADTAFGGSSGTNSLTIGKATQNGLSVTAPDSGTYGDALTMASSGGSGTGAVSYDTTGTACSIPTTGSNVGKLVITSGTGTCSVTATKAADGNYNSATSAAHAVTISKADQATLSVATPDDGTYGQKLTMTSSGGSGTGAVSFAVTGTACEPVASGADAGKLAITSGTGTCSITATKATDSNYKSATSAAHAVTIHKATQDGLSVTAPDSGTYGDALTMASSGGSGTGAVSYDTTGTACSIPTTGSNVGKLVITSGTGTCSVTATKAADGNYNSATSAAHAVTISKADQATLSVATPDDGTYGQKLTMTSSGGSGTGAVSFAVTGTACEPVASGADAGKLAITSGTGTCSITATKATDSNYKSATSAAHTVTIHKATQAAVSVSSPNDGTYGQKLQMAASGGTTLETLVFDVTSDSTACSIVATGTDAGKLSIDSGTGVCKITATRPGNDDYASETSPAHAVTIHKATQSTLSVASPDSGKYGQALTMTSSGGTGTGSVSFSASGSACEIPTSGTNSGKLVITSGTGTCEVTATKAADGNYDSATSAAHTVSISKAKQDALSVASPDDGTYGEKLPMASSGGSGTGAVSFDATGTACSIPTTGDDAGKLVIGSGTGTCSVTATKAADDNYSSATSAAHPVAIHKAGLTVTAKDQSMMYGDAVPPLTYAITKFVAGDTLGTSDVQGAPTLSTTGTSASPARTYPISIVNGTLSSSNYSFTFVGGTLSVSKRQAMVEYTGQNYVAVASASTSVPINLSAKVSRVSGNLGDLSKAEVEFTVKKFNGSVQVTVTKLADASGTAQTTAPVPTADDPYTVEVRILPTNGYWTSGIDVGSLSVIVGSGTGRTAGGGWIADAANDINSKSNFGFTVQNAKTGTKGNSLFIFRKREGNDEVQYVVKSNSWQGGGLTFNVNGDVKRSTFTGRATLQRYVTGVQDTTFSGGNHTFTVDNFDGDLASPRVADAYAIIVQNNTGGLVKQLGTRSAPITLGGGNVLVQKA